MTTLDTSIMLRVDDETVAWIDARAATLGYAQRDGYQGRGGRNAALATPD